MGKYDELAGRIIACVGGKENIDGLTHCATKLRFCLKDEEKADTKGLKTMQGVITVLQKGGQYQVLVGSHAPEVYKSVIEQAEIVIPETVKKKRNIFIASIDTLTAAFAPFLPLLCAMGVLKGLLLSGVFLGWFQKESGGYQILEVIAESLFYFLPVFVGFTTAKKFRMNQFSGMLIGACFVYLAARQMNAFSYSIIPVILFVWAASHIERLWNKILPDAARPVLTPLGVTLVIVPLMYLFTTVVFTGLMELVKITIDWVQTAGPVAEGAFVGGFWQILILFGLDRALWGRFPIMAWVASFAQAGGVLALSIKIKDRKLRQISIPSVISCMLGIAEPGIYGVTLPRKIPFLFSCIGASAGGAVVGYLHECGYVWEQFSMLDWVKKISLKTIDIEKLCDIALAAFIAFLLTMLMVLFTCKEVREEKEPFSINPFPDPEKPTEQKKAIFSPLNGKAVPLNEVGDEVFASGVLGDGIAIEPYEGIVYAPADCKVTTFFPTGHAIGLTTQEGVELLIHIGMDTVELGGQYFKPLVRQEENLKLGQPMLEFDMEGIREKGYKTTTPVIITNATDDRKVHVTAEREITVGDAVLWLG